MPERIQLRRTKGWRKPPNTVVVARPSEFGNPWKVGVLADATPENVVAWYRAALLGGTLTTRSQGGGRWNGSPLRSISVVHVIRELRGKNLACWCPLDRPCHADVLLEVANG